MLQRTQNTAHLLLSLVLLSLSLSLFQSVLLWVQVLVVCSVIMRIALFLNLQKHLPSVRTINLLAVLSALVLAYSGWSLGLLLGMINLLVMASALKLMMMRKQRDFFQLIATQLFLIGSCFIFYQSILFSTFYALVLLMVLLSLAFHIMPKESIRTQINRIGKLVLQATPITILLFLVMPKIEPLWRMPTAKSAESGLSEEVTPGDIASLSQSSSLAFRATFNDNIPERRDLYWRAIVLENFDGKTWSVASTRRSSKRYHWHLDKPFEPNISGFYYDYEVIAEPTQQPWLYALDVAFSDTETTWFSRDYQLQKTEPLHSKFKYKVRSYPTTPLNEGTQRLNTRLNLSLPETGNPRTREWVKELRSQYPDNFDFINAFYRFLREQKFRYTLRPPAMLSDPIDQFLFEHQAGFCSHYASAFGFVMRMANIPTRMVTGYHGGEMHGKNHMSIYQYDAHAWNEVLHPENGWLRYDPTAVIAPDRIRYGLEEAVAYEDTFLAEAPFALARMKDIQWLNELRLMMENADYLWSRWILGFDRNKQTDLFKALIGELEPLKIAAISVGTMLFIGLLLTLFQFRIWFPKIEDPVLHHYQMALQTLATLGITKPLQMGPNEFVYVVQQYAGKDCAKDFSAITKQFVDLNYRNTSNKNELTKSFFDSVRKFRKSYS